MSGISVLLLLFKIITVYEAIEGITSPSILAIAVLFIVAKGIENAGTIEAMLENILGQPHSVAEAILRLTLPIAIASAFMNNTPVVALMIPIVERWALRTGYPVSKLLMPLSFASMLGGMCTLLGTSTNLILADLASDNVTINMFTMSPVGVPLMVLGIGFMCSFSVLMPTKDDAGTKNQVSMPYTCTFMCNHLADKKTLGEVGLTAVSGARLTQHTRPDNDVEEPEETDLGTQEDSVMQQGDLLTFVCTADAIPDLRMFKEISIEQEPTIDRLGPGRRHRKMFEAVIDVECLLIGERPFSEGNLDLYTCAILSYRKLSSPSFMKRWESMSLRPRTASRSSTKNSMHNYDDSENLDERPIGSEEVLEIGDSIVFEAYPSFLERYENTKHFSVIRTLKGLTPRHGKKRDSIRTYVAGGILLLMVTFASLEEYLGYNIFVMALVASALLIMTKCITPKEALGAIKGRVIFAIISTFGVGNAMENTGVSTIIANVLVRIGSFLGPVGMLTLIYLCTAILSCLVSNQATVILLWPVVKGIVDEAPFGGKLSYEQFAIILMMGASTSFATPIGNQTNLMVYSPGNYAFEDFLKMGGALAIFLALAGGVLTWFIV